MKFRKLYQVVECGAELVVIENLSLDRGDVYVIPMSGRTLDRSHHGHVGAGGYFSDQTRAEEAAFVVSLAMAHIDESVRTNKPILIE